MAEVFVKIPYAKGKMKGGTFDKRKIAEYNIVKEVILWLKIVRTTVRAVLRTVRQEKKKVC